MLRHHLHLALRRLAARRGEAAITIGGLALGLAGCLLMLGYVRFERGHDRWLPDHERVFQVQTSIRPPGQPESRLQASSWPIYVRMPIDFPQVEAITSIQAGTTVGKLNGRPLFAASTAVDPSFFRVFDLPFLHGSPATALADPRAIVLTESEARRWFGSAEVLGRTLRLGAGDGATDYRVAAVLRDLPRDTSLKLGIVMSRGNVAAEDTAKPQFGWGNFDQQHFVRLHRAADAAAIEAALPRWEKGVLAGMAGVVDFHLQPIAAVHLGDAQERSLVPGGDPRGLTAFALVAALTLAMAVINFVNLTLARTAARAREVALRRVLGATRRRLAAQFAVEAVVVVGLASLLALALVEVATPSLSTLVGAELPRTYLGDRGLLLPAVALAAVITLIGGAAPALALARDAPARALGGSRGSADAPGAARVRTTLVVVQFAIAIGLIAATFVIQAQGRFLAATDPGFRREGLVQINNAWRFAKGTEFAAARPQLLRVPGVTAVGRTELPLDVATKPQRLMRRAGGEMVSLAFYGIDADYFRAMGTRILAGRALGERYARDRFDRLSPTVLATRGINVVVNRAAAAKLGYATPAAAIGGTAAVAFYAWEGNEQVMVPVTIVGVAADTRLRGPREPPEPVVYAAEEGLTFIVLVRYADASPSAVLAGLERVWRRFEPELPFEAVLADDVARAALAAERTRAILFAGFAGLAIVIACLGLYGLASFATERRVREIGIRKALGARVGDIVRLLAWQFAKPVVLANLLAWPLAWWAMRDWLNGFDARIELTPTPFAAAGLLALAIALAAVAGHAVRAARTNPIHALRYE